MRLTDEAAKVLEEARNGIKMAIEQKNMIVGWWGSHLELARIMSWRFFSMDHLICWKEFLEANLEWRETPLFVVGRMARWPQKADFETVFILPRYKRSALSWAEQERLYRPDYYASPCGQLGFGVSQSWSLVLWFDSKESWFLPLQAWSIWILYVKWACTFSWKLFHSMELILT